MKNLTSNKRSISLVRCSEWIRHASLALFVGSASLAIGMVMSPFSSQAACDINATALEKLGCVGSSAYGPVSTEPAEIIKNIINVFLGVLGILFVVLLLYGGFLWMTARGDGKQVDKAKSLIQEAVIGLTIILSAWLVSYFVVRALLAATTGSPQ